MKEKETNRERFIRIAESRTQKIIDMINKAVEFSFHYYANFLLTYEDFSD